jgi:hypothetical protein
VTLAFNRMPEHAFTVFSRIGWRANGNENGRRRMLWKSSSGSGQMGLASIASEGAYELPSRMRGGNGRIPEELLGEAHRGASRWRLRLPMSASPSKTSASRRVVHPRDRYRHGSVREPSSSEFSASLPSESTPFV